MAHHLLATCLVSSFLSTQVSHDIDCAVKDCARCWKLSRQTWLAQVCIRAQQFNEGKEWNVNYTVKHVSPHRRAYIYRTFRQADLVAMFSWSSKDACKCRSKLADRFEMAIHCL